MRNPVTRRRCVYCRVHNVWDRVRYLDADGAVTTYPAHVSTVESVICLSCDRLQPLGPSSDDSEPVQVEIRAAEIAQEIADMTEWWLYVGINTTEDEDRGWSLAESSMCAHSSGWLAGYLARALATHEEPQ